MGLRRRRDPNSYYGRLTLLKKLFWLYFCLLIFEGALRKWVAPQLSGPLLVIRDPVGVWIIWEAFRMQKWPRRWVLALAVLTVLLVGIFVIQLVLGNNSLLVGLFGLRSYLLPFPVMFIMGENLDQEDLRRMGTCTLWFMLLNTPLAAAQYLDPSSSFLNKGAYEGAGQITYIGARVRASGTFSFSIGLVYFATFAAVFLIQAMVQGGQYAKKWFLWASTFALLLLIPTAGARTLVYQLAAILLAVVVAAMMGVAQFAKVLKIVVPIAILGFLLTFLPLFSDVMSSMTARFTGATNSEGGSVQSSLYDRTIAPTVSAVEDAASSENWIGIGLGRGAVAVQMFLNGTTESATGENEIDHEIGEMGLPVAVTFELFKLFLAISFVRAALARARERETLALLMLPVASILLLQCLLEQPSEQGFMVMACAVCIAAGKAQPQIAAQWLSIANQRLQPPYQRRVQRGPSPDL